MSEAYEMADLGHCSRDPRSISSLPKLQTADEEATSVVSTSNLTEGTTFSAAIATPASTISPPAAVACKSLPVDEASAFASSLDLAASVDEEEPVLVDLAPVAPVRSLVVTFSLPSLRRVRPVPEAEPVENNDGVIDQALFADFDAVAPWLQERMNTGESLADVSRNVGSRAPAVPQIEHDDLATSSTVDVDSPHISSVPSDYSGETDTQVDREIREFEQEAEEEAEQVEEEAKKKGKEVKAKAKEVSAKGRAKYGELKKEAEEKGDEFKAAARERGHELSENRDNPVVVANAIIIGLGATVLGYGAYKRYSNGQLDWSVAGTWAGIIGLFAVGDYYLSAYLFKNRYPPK